jgi:hypothetical protein
MVAAPRDVRGASGAPPDDGRLRVGMQRRRNGGARSQVLAHTIEHVAAVVAQHAIETPDSIKITAINVPTVLSGARQRQARRAERQPAPRILPG